MARRPVDDLEFVFEQPPGGRLHRWGRSVTVRWNNDGERDGSIWWDSATRRWITDDERRERDCCASSHCERVRTFRAFKRHVRKHRYMLLGHRVIWCSRWMNHEVYVDIPAHRVTQG